MLSPEKILEIIKKIVNGDYTASQLQNLYNNAIDGGYSTIEEAAKDDNNPDIEDYVGRGDLTAFYRWKQNDFSLMLRHSLKDGDKSHGAVQFDWAFPITGKLRGNFQLFNGYGESLIDYNHRATYVGLGVSLLDWF